MNFILRRQAESLQSLNLEILVSELSGWPGATRRSKRRRNDYLQDCVRLCLKKIHDFQISRAVTSKCTKHYPPENFEAHLLLDLYSSLSMRTLLLIFFLTLLQRNTVVSSTCYWPDESVVSDSWHYTPCSSTANGVDSACCDENDVCSSTGFCLGRGGYMYRGACTDSSWNAEACCQECRNSMYQLSWHLDPVDGLLIV